MKRVISDEEFESCYIIVARIVSETGDKYLPIFRRMHQERQLREANNELRAIAFQAATGNKTM